MRWRSTFSAALAATIILSGGQSILAPPSASAAAGAAATTTVTGTISYLDRNGTKHPARVIAVQVVDQVSASSSAVLQTVTTDTAGHYTATVPTTRADGTPTEVVVDAFSAYTLTGSVGYSVHADGASPYMIPPLPAAAATGTAMTINLTANNTTASGDAFAVADALDSAMEYTARVNHGALFPLVNYYFPAPPGDTFLDPTRVNTVDLAQSDAFDWDVILHEYGHYLAENLGFLIPGVGGEHYPGENDELLSGLTKTTGLELAWNEGFATFFSLMAQNVEASVDPSEPTIPYAHDSVYDDNDETAPYADLHIDLATDAGSDGVGEDDEVSISRALWQFYQDGPMSDIAIITALAKADPQSFSDAVKVLLPLAGAAPFDSPAGVSPAAEKRAVALGCILAVPTETTIAPTITSPIPGTAADPDQPPMITWDANGGGQNLDSFTVQFWNQNYTTLLDELMVPSGQTSFTPDATEWKNKIVGGTDADGSPPSAINILVTGKSTANAPQTGPYQSCNLTMPVQHVDLVFAIDTTGSMSPYIDSAVASANAIVSSLADDGIDYRIAVVDFKDVDSTLAGCPADPYAARTDLDFSADNTAIQNALAALPANVGGGCDIPEDVYSGIEQGIGMSWRPDAKKAIILLGDAPGHDPEAHSGYTLAKVQADAAAVDPVEVFPILIGDDPTAHAFDQALANATGGQTVDATADPSQVGPAILTAIQAIAAEPVADAGGPYTGTVGAPVTFDASASFSPDDTITSYAWDFTGSGIFTAATGPTTTFTYSAPYNGKVTVRVTDSHGRTAEATATATITGGAAPKVTVDQVVNGTEEKSASPIASPPLTTTASGELVLAFVSADGPTGQRQKITGVTGGGLTWTLASRADMVKGTGTAEVWQAYATTPLKGAVVKAALQDKDWDGAITVVTFTGAAPKVGAAGNDGARKGTPSVSLVTTRNGSLIMAAGHDWSHATAETPGPGQTIVTQNLDTRVNDTYWVQQTTTIATAGTTVTVGDTAPTDNRWELAAIEVCPASTS